MTYRYNRETTSTTTAKCVMCGARVVVDESSTDWYGKQHGAAHARETVYVCDDCQSENDTVQPYSRED